MNITLTPLQAFNAMSKFLDTYYKKTLSDDLGVLLSSMEFLEDNETVDAATWDDWMNILDTDQTITELQAFNAMIKYLILYADLMASEDLHALLHKFKLSDNVQPSKDVWDNWITCVDNTLKEPEGSRSYLNLTK